MTLDQLRIFVAVAQTLNMRLASERLHLSQPAVSAAIAALEERHATKLFDRIGRGLRLNAAGRAFLPEAQAVLRQAEHALQVFGDLEGLVRGELRIAASQTVANHWLPARMARFVTRYPGVRLQLEVANTAKSTRAVIDGHADLAFVEGQIEEAEIQSRTVGTDDIRLFASAGHPLVGRTLDGEDLKRAAWVLREPGSGTRQHLAMALQARFGLDLADLDIRLELPSNGAVLGAAQASQLITAVSDLAANDAAGAGSVVRLDCPLPPRAFRIAWSGQCSLSRAAKAFAQAV